MPLQQESPAPLVLASLKNQRYDRARELRNSIVAELHPASLATRYAAITCALANHVPLGALEIHSDTTPHRITGRGAPQLLFAQHL